MSDVKNNRSFGNYLTNQDCIPEKQSLLDTVKQAGSQAGSAVFKGFSNILSSITVRVSFAKQSLLNQCKNQAANARGGISGKLTETGRASSGFSLRDYLGKINFSFSNSRASDLTPSEVKVTRDSFFRPIERTFNEPRKFN